MQAGRHGLVVLYLPATDMASHRHGPPPSQAHWERLDRHIGRLMQAVGGPARALACIRWLLVGDHGQSQVADGNQALAPDRLFRDLNPVRFGGTGLGTRHPSPLHPTTALCSRGAPTLGRVRWRQPGSGKGLAPRQASTCSQGAGAMAR
ncbi:MAG: alkaline phosphatase family protein [Candidatus Sericytochromatia bacterium]|nr:alkaline phosphatase family protein [Candidatus Tanganyikabacteria bacterium]